MGVETLCRGGQRKLRCSVRPRTDVSIIVPCCQDNLGFSLGTYGGEHAGTIERSVTNSTVLQKHEHKPPATLALAHSLDLLVTGDT